MWLSGMGTEVQYKSYMPGYYSMRDTNEDCNRNTWPLIYGDKTLTNGQYYNGFITTNFSDSYYGYDKNAVKQKMLEHEAIFKNQVCELHRLYRRQRDMMEEVKRVEQHKHRMSIEASSSSSLLPSKITSDAQKWHASSFPLANSSCVRHSIFGTELVTSPLSCTKGNSSKDYDALDCNRPSKVRKKLFDLHLSADQYIDTEECEEVEEKNLSDPSLRRPFGLADLNEPVHETYATTSGDFFGRTTCSADFNCLDLSGRPKLQFLASNGALNTLHVGDGRDLLSYTRVIGSGKSTMNSASHPPLPDKLPTSSISLQSMNGKDLQAPGPFQGARVDSWKERAVGSSKFLDKIQFQSHYTDGLAVGSSPVITFPRFFNSSWGDKSSLSSRHHSQEFADDNNGSSRYNLGLSSRNGFYYGSPSGSIELSATAPNLFPTFSCMPTERLTDHHAHNPFKSSDSTESKVEKDLKSMAVRDYANEIKHEDDLAMPPWLRPKPVCKNDFSSDKFFCHASSSQNTTSSNGRKILGFPIFQNQWTSKTNYDLLEGENAKCGARDGAIDINVACDALFANPKKYIESGDIFVSEGKNVLSLRNNFDLNSSMTEEEELLSQPVESSIANARSTFVEIDLESIPVIDSEEVILCGREHGNPVETPLRDAEPKSSKGSEDEGLVRVAAEAMMSLSVSEMSSNDLLLWFAEMVCSRSDPKIDDFEEMTLQLKETEEEEYMPKPPLVLEAVEADGPGPVSLSGRPRRGPARRGRMKRDFQRDILPGIASLTRHEVNEDIQIFGGLMRATGHNWSSGLTKRNGSRGGTRGRRCCHAATAAETEASPTPLLVERISNVELRLEDRGGLTGWGKTPKRPRRQRCHSTNSVAVS